MLVLLHEKGAGKSLRGPQEEVLCQYEVLDTEIKLLYPNSARLRQTGKGGCQWTPLLQAQEGRPASSSSHSDAKILPLNTARAHVNTMTSLRLPFK